MREFEEPDINRVSYKRKRFAHTDTLVSVHDGGDMQVDSNTETKMPEFTVHGSRTTLTAHALPYSKYNNNYYINCGDNSDLRERLENTFGPLSVGVQHVRNEGKYTVYSLESTSASDEKTTNDSALSFLRGLKERKAKTLDEECTDTSGDSEWNESMSSLGGHTFKPRGPKEHSTASPQSSVSKYKHNNVRFMEEVQIGVQPKRKNRQIRSAMLAQKDEADITPQHANS